MAFIEDWSLFGGHGIRYLWIGVAFFIFAMAWEFFNPLSDPLSFSQKIFTIAILIVGFCLGKGGKRD
jgi:hypothetical protein